MENSQFNHISLRYLDLTIKVGGLNLNDIAWLKEFLCPQFKVIDSPFYDYEINFIVDDRYFNELLRKGSQVKTEVNGFILDKKIVKLCLWKLSRDDKIFFDEEFKVFYVMSNDKNEISILARPLYRIYARTALMRVIREFAMNYARANGRFFTHASAFSYEDKGIMIAGSEDSGKTSLLIYFLQNLASQYISNDRVLLCLDKDIPIIYGMGTIVTISRETLRMFPQLQNNLSQYKFHHRYTIDEILEGKFTPYKLEQKKFTFSPGQFCRLLDVKSSARSKLSAILFPHISKKKDSIHLERLSEDVAMDSLREAQLSKNILGAQTIFKLNGTNAGLRENELSYEEFISRAVPQIPCFDCYLGLEAYEDNKAIELLSQMFTRKVAQLL